MRLLNSLVLIVSFSLTSSGKSPPALYQVTHPVEHGEGPVWSERHQALYFVDLHAGKIISYDPLTDTSAFLKLYGDVSVVVPVKDDPHMLIAAVNRSVIAIELNAEGLLKKFSVLVTVANDKPASRFNDGKADSLGRLWFGTMGYENASGVMPNDGSLYLINQNNLRNPEVKIAPVNISNGLTWNKPNDKFFYIDSPTRQIKKYDYDSKTGAISNEVVLFDLKNHPELGGVPDGMTIDKDDNLWVALYNGGSVIKINSINGKLLQVIAIPAQCVTSVAWGGHKLETLYVTTSRYSLSNEEKLKQPAAGSLFAIKHLDTEGVPTFEADII